MRKKVQRAFIALGSNIEPRAEYMQKALDMLRQACGLELIKVSNLYETDPKGYEDQADFLNQVVMVETILEARALLELGAYIERSLKRERKQKNGPRTIDVDLLAYEAEQYITEELWLPHPRIKERAFVLVPWAEIAPNFFVVSEKATVQELQAALDPKELAGVRPYLKQ